ncbi:hypothetical protein [Saccharothrix obliqua]|uniref:hypothetical protein n=1 Tax=Saccharothrix obliqua TaxID=2861747 RepID=UPI001C5CE078|nr:hypothetical protein [Saccharothrix obliqua]MBW4718683.1 hypothetical protein [Saccharothrix obliqua]
MSGLPPVGAEIPCSAIAEGSVLEIGGTSRTLTFRGGMKYRVEVHPDGAYEAVGLRMIGFRMAADTDEGEFVLEQTDEDTDPMSSLRYAQRYPPRLKHQDLFDFTATLVVDGEQIILVTRRPMSTSATLTGFPSRGDSYQLDEPVELVAADDPDTVVARLTAFPSKRGGL